MDIRIEGDPTSWTLSTPIDPGQLAGSIGPVALEVSEPLGGRLLLSPRSVGSVVFLQPAADPRHGVVPNGVRLPEQCLYVASTTGPDPHSNPPRYYLLPQSADLTSLEARITAAIGEKTVFTVDFTGPADPGVVVLNGGTVPFVVLCPASPGKLSNRPDASRMLVTEKVFGFLLAALAAQLALDGLSDVGVIHLTGH